jgi:cephalosporin hydroxylase
LDGRACDALLELYAFGVPRDDSLPRLQELHHAAGLALSEVSDSLGQDPQEAKQGLIDLMNRKRSEALQSAKLSDAELAELDREFYDVQSGALTCTDPANGRAGSSCEADVPQAQTATSIEQCFAEAPALCIKHDSYFQAYETLLAQYVGQPITFVEVGVFNGGSLHMWRRYFGEQARIIGVDLNPEARKWQAEGFEIFIGDQSNANFWRDFYQTVGAIDVLLDDGGHMNHQQLVTTEYALEHINDGGMLIVEDVHTSYMPGFNSKPEHSFVNFGKHIVDAVNSRFPDIDTGANLYQDRVWSVSFHESIVAFHIDRRRCFQSSWISNAGAATTNQDFRHEGMSFDSMPDIEKYFIPGN